MLGRHDVGATLAVSDIAAARSFYEDTLGLTATVEMGDAVVYSAGNSQLFVYRSDFAGTNQATAATWAVGGEFDGVVQALRDKGVTFERYDDLPGVTRDGDIHVLGDMRGVWFRDPDGNIIAVVESP
jgi:catechol 2,3-dioxygenase-like lactoylglutathione lyase family enzyme